MDRCLTCIVALAATCGLALALETLVFVDEFDEFDLSIWEHEITAGGGGMWQFQLYTNNRSNSYVRDSKLFIKPTLLEDEIGDRNLRSGYTYSLWGDEANNQCTGNAFFGCERTSGGGGNILNPIKSARIRTAKRFSFKYGRVEIRAKLPVGDWLWPAIWMLPSLNSYGNWPASGEIDIVEARGNAPGYSKGGVDTVSSTLHWGPFAGTDSMTYPLTHATKTISAGENFGENFHIFGMIWNEDGIMTYLDEPSNVILNVSFPEYGFWERGFGGTTYDNPWAGRQKAAPFDQEFYFVINLAVGGISDYWPDSASKPWSNSDPHAVNTFYDAKEKWLASWQGEECALQIDYIKVYQDTQETPNVEIL